MTPAAGDRFTVRLAGVPRALVGDGLERTEELARELRLVTSAAAGGAAATTGGAGAAGLPARLTDLLVAMRAAGDGRDVIIGLCVADVELEHADADPDEQGGALDVTVELPVGAEHDALALALLLEESDAYCERGEVLTLPRSPRLLRLRWWEATEIVRQRHGLPATPFPG